MAVSCFPHPPTQHIAVAILAPYLELDIVALYTGHPGVIDGWSGMRLTPIGAICGSEGSALGCCSTGQLAVVSPSSPLLPCVGEPIINPTIILSWSADRGDRLGYARPIRCARRMFIFMFLPQYLEASLLCATTRSDEPRIQTGLAVRLGPAPTQSPFQTDHSPCWWSWSVVFWFYSRMVSVSLCSEPTLAYMRRHEPISFGTPAGSAFASKKLLEQCRPEVARLANATQPFPSAQLSPHPNVSSKICCLATLRLCLRWIHYRCLLPDFF